MNKFLRILLLVVLIATPLIMYRSCVHRQRPEVVVIPFVPIVAKPEIALIFDDLGESLKEFKNIYSLNIPVTVSVIPGLRFSNNIAYMGERSGCSVMVHLPLAPKHEERFMTKKYTFISAHQTQREAGKLLHYYLNAVRPAIGANNHMGSEVTENRELMRLVLRKIKEKNFFFVDSYTSRQSVACDIAKEEGVRCAENEGFVDAISDEAWIETKLAYFEKLAAKKKKIIIIAHPKEVTLRTLRKKIPQMKTKIKFITIKEYFES
ncbi:MAG: divergent polysaccharide deacetylase family protein [Candidatus Omnitrophica bacterium]|nr:divergent polysaccharide deacetylase family protein [Candidatus Omnitrophota bacterium]